MRWANLTPYMLVLALITSIIHPTTLYFAVAGSIAYQSNAWETNLQVESGKHMEKYYKIRRKFTLLKTTWS